MRTVWNPHDRKVYRYDEHGVPTFLREFTDEENAAADANITIESRMDSIEERLMALEAHVYGTPEEVDAPNIKTFEDFGGIWPAGHLIIEGGVVYRNVSGVPLTSPPSAFPGGPSRWTHLFVVESSGEEEPSPPEGNEWQDGAAYQVGDVVTYNGGTWRCKLAHTSHSGWAPSVYTHAVWEAI